MTPEQVEIRAELEEIVETIRAIRDGYSYKPRFRLDPLEQGDTSVLLLNEICKPLRLRALVLENELA